MNDLRKATITTLEVAEMMETEHSKIIIKKNDNYNFRSGGDDGSATQ